MIITPEMLHDGRVLRALSASFDKTKTDKAMISLLSCLRDSQIWMPVKVEVSEKDYESLTNMSEDSPFVQNDDIHLVPDLLTNSTGIYLPVFSSADQMGDDYLNNYSQIRKHVFTALDMAEQADEVTGIVLDPFTQPVIIRKGLFSTIRSLPSKLSV